MVQQAGAPPAGFAGLSRIVLFGREKDEFLCANREVQGDVDDGVAGIVGVEESNADPGVAFGFFAVRLGVFCDDGDVVRFLGHGDLLCCDGDLPAQEARTVAI